MNPANADDFKISKQFCVDYVETWMQMHADDGKSMWQTKADDGRSKEKVSADGVKSGGRV